MGHNARLADNRWTPKVTNWGVMDDSRPRARFLKMEGSLLCVLEICDLETYYSVLVVEK